MKLFLLFCLCTFCLIVNGAVDCVVDPGNHQCMNFQIADDVLEGFTKSLCGMMYMPGCTIHEVCAVEKNAELYPEFCGAFAVYKIICTDMPGMGGCSSYKSMCMNSSSVVEQCNTEVIPLPKTSKLASDINSICTSMNMNGCDQCPGGSGPDCDGLTVYSNLCLAMDMEECTDWKDMCVSVPNWALCGGSGNIVPSMIMYFHTGINEYILIKEWVPQTISQYILVVAIVFVSSVVYELLKFFRWKMEMRISAMTKRRQLIKGGHSNQDDTDIPGWTCSTSAVRAIFHFIEVLFGSVLMLLIMTYNVGIFSAIIIGRAIGSFIVGNRMDNSRNSYPGQNDTAECH